MLLFNCQSLIKESYYYCWCHHSAPHCARWLVAWLEFNVPFQHQDGYIMTEGQAWTVILTQ